MTNVNTNLLINFRNVLKVKSAGLLKRLEGLIKEEFKVFEGIFAHLIFGERPANLIVEIIH